MLYGEPCYYGFVDYIVLSSLDYERPLRTDYKFEQDRERGRAVHRYDRVKVSEAYQPAFSALNGCFTKYWVIGVNCLMKLWSFVLGAI